MPAVPGTLRRAGLHLCRDPFRTPVVANHGGVDIVNTVTIL